METLYTLEEAADFLKLHPETVRRFLREKRLKGHLFGRVWRIPQSALEQWLRETSNVREDHEPQEKAG